MVKPMISILIPCFNEQEVLPVLRSELTAFAARVGERYALEFCFVDDGSRDATWTMIQDFAAQDGRVRALSLSRNFGHQAALSAGYDMAAGDAVICIDADLQDPLSVIEDMLQEWHRGADIVFARRQRREGESLGKKATAAFFYRLMHVVGANHVRLDSGDFRLMSRKAVVAFQSMRETHRFVRGMVGWMGFQTAEVVYVRQARQAGTTKYSLRKMVRLASDALVSSSILPMRLAFVAAFSISSMILSYLLWTLARFFVGSADLVPGWTSLILAIVGFGTANLIGLGIAGEYIGRIYEQVKGRPIYLVKNAVQGPGHAQVATRQGAKSAETAAHFEVFDEAVSLSEARAIGAFVAQRSEAAP